MTPGPVEDYLARLERALRHRRLDDRRIVAEVREHLADAIADARQRGLSDEDAERVAFDRLGAPETIAAHAFTEGNRTMIRLAAALETMWRRKWWILGPTVVTAVVTSVMSYYLLPTRYRSESVIHIVAPRVPEPYEQPTATDRSGARFRQISQIILTRPRLERIISEFGLYEVPQGSAPVGDVVLRMQRDIGVNLLSSEDDLGAFNVSFVSSDPRTAMRITERLASLFVEENLRDRETQVESTSDFIDSQIAELRGRIIAYEATLETLRANSAGRPLSQADLLPYEVLQERYKALLVSGEESRIAAYRERRQVGAQFRIIEAARVPERPVGPSRLGVNLAGTFAGFGLGLVSLSVRGRPKNSSS